MSVILEALQKARSDKKSKGPHGDGGTARVLEPQSNGPVMISSADRAHAPHAPAGSSKNWILATAVIMSLLLMVCLIGGMFWLLYDQVRRVNTTVTTPATETLSPNGALNPAALGVLPLPTPVPMQELPVQPPAVSAAAPPPSNTAAAPAAPAVKEFTLGSIVCEAGDCLASLNGRSVKVGDKVKDWTVLEITPSTLLMQNAAGEKRSLSLFD